MSAKKKASKKVAKKAAKKKVTAAKKKAAAKGAEEKTKEIVLNARKRNSTPALFKTRKSKNSPVVFTMEDVKGILDDRKKAVEVETKATAKKAKKKAAKKKVAKVAIKEEELPEPEHRNHSPASLLDILGFNPNDGKTNASRFERKVPKKYQKFYKALLELREHVSAELDLHTSDTLKRSSKEDSGDLSGYGQHMADAGTDTFDRDFALSLVSNEQEALYEIEEAIQRIFDDNYGVCEITGETIDEERLLAVPFTRCSLEGQRKLEQNKRHKSQRAGGLFGELGDELSTLNEDVEDN